VCAALAFGAQLRVSFLVCYHHPSLFFVLLQVDPELRRALLDEALETQEQDNEELLRKVRQRMDK
jgi:hypothetical protein